MLLTFNMEMVSSHFTNLFGMKPLTRSFCSRHIHPLHQFHRKSPRRDRFEIQQHFLILVPRSSTEHNQQGLMPLGGSICSQCLKPCKSHEIKIRRHYKKIGAHTDIKGLCAVYTINKKTALTNKEVAASKRDRQLSETHQQRTLL